MRYNLGVLNDKDFEELCKDLLEKELSLSLQNFKTGKDGGIDLRYASNSENEIVVQAKHLLRSKFSDLKIQLKTEKKSMLDLDPQPGRYILFTTLSLNPQEVDTIVSEMSPFIRNSQDVYGLDRIESLISNSPEIENKFYKIWITSTNVLQRILHSGIKGSSEFLESKILKKISLFVRTTNYDDAVLKLNEHNFIIITGDPGIGKTTISYLLIYDLLAKGYELIYIEDKIKDGVEVISPDPEKRQVIFFDDFFGANLYDILNPRNSETAVIGLIERVQTLKNKFLILTTRTTILKQATHNYEKFNRSRLGEISNYEVLIEAYSKYDKARILYNHLYHSGLPEWQYNVFFRSETYMGIIEHKNYFPRLIEFITTTHNLEPTSEQNIVEYIFDKLDHPEEIWRSVHETQLNDEDRFLVTTLFSLGGYNVEQKKLEAAFEERYRYEIDNNGFQSVHNAFNVSVRRLSDGIIKSVRNPADHYVAFSLINPSVGDFLISYLNKSYFEQKRILYSAVYFEQYLNYFSVGFAPQIEIPDDKLFDFFEVFENKYTQMISVYGPGKTRHAITAIYVYWYYFGYLVSEERLFSLWESIDFEEIEAVDLDHFKIVLEFLVRNKQVKHFVGLHWKNVFTHPLRLCGEVSDFESLINTLKKYGVDEDTWRLDADFTSLLRESVNSCFAKSVDDIDLSSEEERIVENYHEGYKDRAADIIIEKLLDEYADFLKDCGLSDLYVHFVEDLELNDGDLLDNLISNYDFSRDMFRPEYRSDPPPPVNVDAEIHRLFER